MAKVAPAILATTAAEYNQKLTLVQQLSPRYQVDVVDGKFAPNLTVILEDIHNFDGGQLDLQLMVEDPTSMIGGCGELGANLIIIHFESKCDHVAVFESIRTLGAKVGLALNPDTTIDQCRDLLTKIDHLLIMTVHPGFSGQTFLADNLAKIAQAKAINPNLEAGVDGGVNQSTARQAVESGANILYSGSFIFTSPDPQTAFEGLTAIAEEA